LDKPRILGQRLSVRLGGPWKARRPVRGGSLVVQPSRQHRMQAGRLHHNPEHRLPAAGRLHYYPEHRLPAGRLHHNRAER
jgi:hypothetical protein